MLLLPVVGN